MTVKSKKLVKLKSTTPKNKEHLAENQLQPSLKQEKPKSDVYNDPAIHAANIVQSMFSGNEVDFSDLYQDLKRQSEQLAKGDISQLETMLLNQAYALQALFLRASLKVANAEYLNNLQVWGTLALKAQNQCRQTLATLADMRNPKPKTTFIKQQNNAVNQQVNNGLCENSKIIEESGQNELLSGATYEALDNRRTQAASAINPPLKALETINRG